MLYDNQGKYDEAEPLYQRALAISEKVLGPDHPDTATSLNNLAGLYNNQGKYDEAEPLYQRALAIDEKVWGQIILNSNIPEQSGSALQNQGKYDEAEPLYQRALAIERRCWGQITLIQQHP